MKVTIPIFFMVKSSMVPAQEGRHASRRVFLNPRRMAATEHNVRGTPRYDLFIRRIMAAATSHAPIAMTASGQNRV